MHVCVCVCVCVCVRARVRCVSTVNITNHSHLGSTYSIRIMHMPYEEKHWPMTINSANFLQSNFMLQINIIISILKHSDMECPWLDESLQSLAVVNIAMPLLSMNQGV